MVSLYHGMELMSDNGDVLALTEYVVFIVPCEVAVEI